MAIFLLIHGAWHGGWCWEEVVPLLEARGHTVLAPDLPGMGADHTALREDVLGQWTDAMTAIAEAQAEPVVLVGHSRGGLIASTVAERVPDLVAKVIYLCAFLVADGETLLDLEARVDAVAAAVRLDEAKKLWIIDADRAAPAFYGRVAPEKIRRAVARLTDEPYQPFTARVSLSVERFGRVPRAYIETTEDGAIPLFKQREMQTRWPCSPVVTLESDHSPFYSMPEQLADVLADLTKLP